MAAPIRTFELTTRGHVLAWLCAGSAMAAWLSGDENARLAAAMLLAPLLVDFVLKPRGLALVSARIAPRRIAAGAPFVEAVHLQHHGTRPLRECLLHEPKTMRDQRTLVDRLEPGTKRRLELHCRSSTRSHQLERVLLLQSSWPLGFFAVRASLVVSSELVTEPARVRLRAEVVQAVADRDPAPRDRSLLPGAEFHSLRDHLPEEDARGVHALRSAMLGSLVRRVTHGRLPREVGLVLDLRRPPGRPLTRGSRRFEWSLGAAATLVETLLARDARVRVLVFASRTARHFVEGPAQLRDLLTFLAEAAASPHRALELGVLDELHQHEHCFWIPAGGFLTADEANRLAGPVTVIGGDTE